MFKLTFFHFNNQYNTEHWSESLVKKLVLRELGAESTQSQGGKKGAFPGTGRGLHRRGMNRHKANTGDSAKNTIKTY